MAIESAVTLRRVARIACLVLLFGLGLGSAAMAQLPITFTPGNPPPVTVGSIIPFNHGKTGVWKQIYSMRVDPVHGNILFLDSATSTLYQLAPGAATPSQVVGPSTGNSDCSALEKNGTYWNAAIAFDKWDNLYVTDRYGSAVQFCRAPYDATAGTWSFSAAAKWTGPKAKDSSGNLSAIAPQDLQVGDDGVTFYVSTSNTSSIYKYTVDQSGNVTNVTALATALQTMVSQIAVDHAGNLFFVENQGSYPNNVHGIREIPAGSATVVGDGTGKAESALRRVDQGGWDGITGMYFDKQGNLYFSSQNNSSYGGFANGVFMIPNEGTPTNPNLVWADTIMVSPVNASYPPMVDSRGLLWIATGWYSNWAPDGTNAPNCDTNTVDTAAATCLTSTIVLWKPGAADAGSTPVGGGTNLKITAYSSDGSTITLTANNSYTENQVVNISAGAGDPLAPLNGLSFFVSQTGLSSTQFQISSSLVAAGSGATNATVNANPTQTVLYMFNQPMTVGKFDLAQPSGGNFTRLTKNALANPTATAKVPICTDGASYPKFSSNMITDSAYGYCTYYVQLNTPLVGPVEGELRMLDDSNNVIDGSNTYIGGVGQGPAVSAVSSAAVQSIASGLNDPRQVAADLQGNTYVADHALKAIEKYPAGTTSPASGKIFGTGLNGPTGVTVDGVGNLYIGDSGKVIEIPFINGALAASQQTVIASGLGTGNLNLAVNGAGDVFVADQQKGQVVEIPNPQTTLMLDGLPFPVLAAGAGLKAPSAIAADASGNVWVADGANLWEIDLPFGGASEVLTNALQAPVTGLAVDPSGSVFVAQANGLVWIPYNAATGSLNINGQILISAGLGTASTPTVPWGLALDGLQNLYASYGSGSIAGLAQLGIGGSLDFNAFGELNPNVPFEVDAQILNLGNQPLALADLATDQVSGTDAADYTVVPATLNSPACGPATSAPPGGSCYLGLVLQAPSPGVANASVTVLSNAANAVSGVNIGMTGNVIQDLRPASQVALSVTPSSGVVYPGKVTVKVTVTADPTYGMPSGSVSLSVSSANGVLPKQIQSLDATGSVTFSYSNLLGGTYNVNANYAGDGAAGANQNTCSPAGSLCFAGSAGKATFTVTPATPVFAAGPPVTNSGCLAWTDSNCSPNPVFVTPWAGNTYVQSSKPVWITASVTSKVGTPSGTITFIQNGKPADPSQGVNGAVPLNGNGVATFSLQNLPLGVYNLTAVYSGDVNYAKESQSLPEFEVILPSVQVTQVNGGTVNITAGTPVQATLSLKPLVGFSGDVSLECNSTDSPVAIAPPSPATMLPAYSQCTFLYANTVTGTSPVGKVSADATNIVVTISTNVPTNGGTSSAARRRISGLLGGLFGLGMLGLIAGRKRFNRSLMLVCLGAVLSGAFMGITSCTNAGYSTPPPAPKVKTPAGTYNVQIVTYDYKLLQQNSLSTPVFTLPVNVK
jgi:hypothetical protein